jgi:hypothetical protein
VSRLRSGDGDHPRGCVLHPPPVLTHATLLAELARLVPGADVDQLALVARLASSNAAWSRTLARTCRTRHGISG